MHQLPLVNKPPNSREGNRVDFAPKNSGIEPVKAQFLNKSTKISR